MTKIYILLSNKGNYGFVIRLKFYSVEPASYLLVSGWVMYMDLSHKSFKSEYITYTLYIIDHTKYVTKCRKYLK